MSLFFFEKFTKELRTTTATTDIIGSNTARTKLSMAETFHSLKTSPRRLGDSPLYGECKTASVFLCKKYWLAILGSINGHFSVVRKCHIPEKSGAFRSSVLATTQYRLPAVRTIPGVPRLAVANLQQVFCGGASVTATVARAGRECHCCR